MSSTKRGATRATNDFYCTPEWCVTALYETIQGPKPTLDPCAGNGGLVEPVNALYPRTQPCRGFEIQPELVETAQMRGLPVTLSDGLAVSWIGEHIVLNPPYSEAEKWIEKAVAEAHSTVALLRLGFLASKRRNEWMKKHPPYALVILSRRPDFTGRGGDSADYAWFCWAKQGDLFKDTQLKWIK